MTGYNRPIIMSIIGAVILTSIVYLSLNQNQSNLRDRKHIGPFKETVTVTPAEESNKRVINPDQGFIKPIQIYMTPTYVRVAENDPDSTYWVQCDISEFSEKVNHERDKELTQAALDGLENAIKKIKGENKSIFIRFFYDPHYEGHLDTECSMEMIHRHIQQLAPLLLRYKDVLQSIQAGFLGPWGEMHTSRLATEQNKVQVARWWLEETKGSNVPITVRYPKTIYLFHGKNSIDEMWNITPKPGDEGYLLGLFNDGMYGTNDDTGTWREDRDKEINWIVRQNDHLPYGGEAITDGGGLIPEQRLENCIPEMFKKHLSFLNIEWDPKLFDRWKGMTYHSSIAGHPIFEGVSGYDFMYAHFGYRLVMTKISCEYDSPANHITVQLKNTGFGTVHKIKKVGLVYAYRDNRIINEEYDLATFTEKQESIEFDATFPQRTYDSYGVYLRLYHSIENRMIRYPIRFANSNIYNDNVEGNFLFYVDSEGRIITNH